MNLSIAEIAQSPTLYPLFFDPERACIEFIRLSEADYYVASFLDQRVRTPEAKTIWVRYDEVVPAIESIKAKPLNFIFHAGHVGSTLVSRLLDQIPGVLGLREPFPLRTFADLFDTVAYKESESSLQLFLKLWSRGFSSTNLVVLKATSIACRIAPKLLVTAPESKAIYLDLSAEAHISAVLANETNVIDLRRFSERRHARLTALLGDAPPCFDRPGELAGEAWLVEKLNCIETQKAAGQRILHIDFNSFLTDVEGTLTRIARHFSLDVSPETVSALARSPVLGRYSKTPYQRSFSPQQRASLLFNANERNREQIRNGLALISDIANRHPEIASMIG